MGDVIRFRNQSMLRKAVEHLAAAEDMCGTSECAAVFETIRANMYRRLARHSPTDLDSNE